MTREIRNASFVVFLAVAVFAHPQRVAAVGGVECGTPTCTPNPHQLEVICTFDNNVYDPMEPAFFETCQDMTYSIGPEICQQFDPFAMDVDFVCYDAGLPFNAADGSITCLWYDYEYCDI
jgi:hypothetical protein